jgi:hypothetical protein
VFISYWAIKNSLGSNWALSNLAILIPITVAIFWVPASVSFARRWDIWFQNPTTENGELKITLENLGETRFGFNRVALVARKGSETNTQKKFDLWEGGIFTQGADFAKQHINGGCVLEAGMPIDLFIRDAAVSDCLKQIREPYDDIQICLYYHGSEQETFSVPISRDLMRKYKPL